MGLGHWSGSRYNIFYPGNTCTRQVYSCNGGAVSITVYGQIMSSPLFISPFGIRCRIYSYSSTTYIVNPNAILFGLVCVFSLVLDALASFHFFLNSNRVQTPHCGSNQIRTNSQHCTVCAATSLTSNQTGYPPQSAVLGDSSHAA
jgi:hypothetical protein